jgi:hypothetical protein
VDRATFHARAGGGGGGNGLSSRPATSLASFSQEEAPADGEDAPSFAHASHSRAPALPARIVMRLPVRLQAQVAPAPAPEEEQPPAAAAPATGSMLVDYEE